MKTDRRESEPTLSQLQRWMQAVIVHPEGVTMGIQSSAARQELDVPIDAIESVITRSQAQTSIERLEIYSHAYSARLIECLRSQFPMLAQATGDDVFELFAREYLQQHPSQSYTLGQLGEQFVDFLQRTRPEGESDKWPDFLIDLARLEWEFDQVFDGPGAEGQPLLSIAAIREIPVDRWHESRLVCVPCLRLLSLRYPVHEYYRTLRHGKATDPPMPEVTRLAILRRDYIVRYFSLSASQFTLLQAIMQGASIGDAISPLAEGCTDWQSLATQLHAWFSLWTAEGFFMDIDLTI